MPFTELARYMHHVEIEDFAVLPEEESSVYESGVVTHGGGEWRVRTARVTPKKPGAFVAVWRRADSGETEPFSDINSLDGLLVFVNDGPNRGVFRFTTETLKNLRLISHSGTTGKRGFRVYPSWCSDINSQATRTQRAQSPYFERY